MFCGQSRQMNQLFENPDHRDIIGRVLSYLDARSWGRFAHVNHQCAEYVKKFCPIEYTIIDATELIFAYPVHKQTKQVFGFDKTWRRYNNTVYLRSQCYEEEYKCTRKKWDQEGRLIEFKEWKPGTNQRVECKWNGDTIVSLNACSDALEVRKTWNADGELVIDKVIKGWCKRTVWRPTGELKKSEFIYGDGPAIVRNEFYKNGALREHAQYHYHARHGYKIVQSKDREYTQIMNYRDDELSGLFISECGEHTLITKYKRNRRVMPCYIFCGLRLVCEYTPEKQIYADGCRTNQLYMWGRYICALIFSK